MSPRPREYRDPVNPAHADPQQGAAPVRVSESVGVTELRRNLSVYLRRVGRGERFVVTNRKRPVAELAPVPFRSDLDRLIAEGKVSRPLRRGLPEPIELTGGAQALSRALEEVRGDRWRAGRSARRLT